MALHYSGDSTEFGGCFTRPPTKAQCQSARQTKNIDGQYPDDFLSRRAGDSYPEIYIFEDDSDGDDRLPPMSTGDAQQRQKIGFHQSKSHSRRQLFFRNFSRVEDNLTTTRSQRRDATDKESKLCQERQKRRANDTKHTSSRRRSSNRSRRKPVSDRNCSNGRSRLHNSSSARVSHDCEGKMLLVRSKQLNVMEKESKLRQERQSKQTKDTRHYQVQQPTIFTTRRLSTYLSIIPENTPFNVQPTILFTMTRSFPA